MAVRRGGGVAVAEQPELWRIGEVARETGVTARTLRYWEELELLRPAAHGPGGERRYASSDLARVRRIRDLQELLGFTLAEVRAVLGTEDVDVLDRVRSELDHANVPAARRRSLLDEAMRANEQLVARLDDTLARIAAFRDERVEIASRLRDARAELEGDPE